MYSETYELAFYDHDGMIDSIQQYRTEAEAREAMNYFDEPDSAELYSIITLSKTVWSPESRNIILESFCF